MEGYGNGHIVCRVYKYEWLSKGVLTLLVCHREQVGSHDATSRYIKFFLALYIFSTNLPAFSERNVLCNFSKSSTIPSSWKSLITEYRVSSKAGQLNIL